MSARLVTYRRELAELRILESYDSVRSTLGHDYGCGQRGAELARRRRRLEDSNRYRDLPFIEALTDAELADAWSAVGAPRMRRAESEDFRRETPATIRTRRAWTRVRALYAPDNPSPDRARADAARELEAPAPLPDSEAIREGFTRAELEATELALRVYRDSAPADTDTRELEAMRSSHARILRELEARG